MDKEELRYKAWLESKPVRIGDELVECDLRLVITYEMMLKWNSKK